MKPKPTLLKGAQRVSIIILLCLLIIRFNKDNLHKQVSEIVERLKRFHHGSLQKSADTNNTEAA
jgi:hypothetical protein